MGYFVAKARKLLGEADGMLAMQYYDAAGRTAYLAGFHAAQALISERTGRAVKTHRGVNGELHRLTKDDPRLDTELRAFLGRTYNLKAIADYETGPGRTSRTASSILERRATCYGSAMHWPSWSADTAATVQAIAAIAQGVLTILALIAAIGIPWWQLRQGRAEERKRREAELVGLRQGLHTEVGVVALQCLAERQSWIKATATAATKNVRTAKLPRLTIYEANCNRIGLLTRNEISSLIGFSSTLHDISH
jgi:uncharacterized protein (UPF0332 family)